jgi:pimeloyl-ACP methyl ester carboxylesterase
MPFIQANNAEFYYELHGAGHPLVLIAGYACDHTYWLPVLEPLAKRYQVLIFDNRAVGQTKDNGEPLSADLMARDVMAICNELKLNKPHIVGQSLGGTIAQTVAALFPDKISKLAILSSTAKWRQTLLFACATLLEMRKNQFDLSLIIDLMLPWVYDDHFLLDPNNVQLIKKLILENPYIQSLPNQIRQFNFMRSFDGREQLKRIVAPTLIGYGVNDIASMPVDSAFMAENICGAKLVKFECAHGIVIELPQQVAKVLIEFL